MVPILTNASTTPSTIASVPVEVPAEPSPSSTTPDLSNAVQDEIPSSTTPDHPTQLITEQGAVLPHSHRGVSPLVNHEPSPTCSSMAILPDTSASCSTTQLNQHAMITRSKQSDDLVITAFSDADWSSDVDDRRSTTG
ncbi:hypothetical protein V6N13_147360 [Hibiscus sabdariffa]